MKQFFLKFVAYLCAMTMIMGVAKAQDNALANELLGRVADQVLNCGQFYSAVTNVNDGADDGWRIWSSNALNSNWRLVETLTIRGASGTEVRVRSNFNDGRSDVLKMRIQPDNSFKLLSSKFVDYRCRRQSQISWSDFRRHMTR